MDGFLIPIIMSVVSGKMYKDSELDLLYIVTTASTIMSTKECLSRSRINSPLLKTISLISSMCISLLIATLVKAKFIMQMPTLSEIVLGVILFGQVIMCLIIRFELRNRAKRKFSEGESLILSQLSSMAYLVWALSIYSKFNTEAPFYINKTTEILLNIGMALFLSVFLPTYYLMGERRNTFTRYVVLFLGVLICFYVSKLSVKTSRINNPLTWLIDFIFASHQRISLFSLWLSTLVACVSFATSWSRMVGQTNSLARKIFHIAICVVFITGYQQDLEFTRFASGGMIIIMLMLEMIRVWHLWPVGQHLESVCQALRGKWDNRYLTLSHIYLLLGTMIPLWLLPQTSDPSKLSLSSGLISIGIGDTAAAIVGTFFGRHKIGQHKTFEGLIGNFISMIIFKLIWVGYLGILSEYSFVIAALATAFVEASSLDCDNLLLPLVMILSLEVF